DEIDATVSHVLGLESQIGHPRREAVITGHAGSSKRSSFLHFITAPSSPRGIWTWLKDRTPIGRRVVMKAARASIKSNATNYPALPAILTAVAAGMGNRNGRGYEVERTEFAKLLQTETHRSLLGLFFQRERARKQETWVRGLATKPRKIVKVGVLGS